MPTTNINQTNYQSTNSVKIVKRQVQISKQYKTFVFVNLTCSSIFFLTSLTHLNKHLIQLQNFISPQKTNTPQISMAFFLLFLTSCFRHHRHHHQNDVTIPSFKANSIFIVFQPKKIGKIGLIYAIHIRNFLVVLYMNIERFL